MKTITTTNRPAPSETGALAIPEGVEEIDAFAYEDDRRINSVCFPESLKRIGAHAFYNCRSIYKIRLGSSGTDIGDGAFKNCERLSEIEIVKNSESIRALKSVLYDAHRQVRVRIIYPDVEALVVFPYFMDNYEENTPARIVMHISEGAGTPYRECIYSGDVDYKAYDELFSTGINLDIYDSAADIAICRLLRPYKLSDHACTAYRVFLHANVTPVFTKLMEGNRLQTLEELLSLDIARREELDGIIDAARAKNYTEALAVLLKVYGEKYGGSKPRYEF